MVLIRTVDGTSGTYDSCNVVTVLVGNFSFDIDRLLLYNREKYTL